VSRLSYSTARRDVTTGATRTTRVQEHRYSVDWGGHVRRTFFQKLFLKLMQTQSTKDWICTREHYCFSVVRHIGTSTARRARHDALDTSYVSCRFETWRAMWIWAIYNDAWQLICYVQYVVYVKDCWVYVICRLNTLSAVIDSSADYNDGRNGQSRALEVRFCSRRSFSDLRLIYGWQVTTLWKTVRYGLAN